MTGAQKITNEINSIIEKAGKGEKQRKMAESQLDIIAETLCRKADEDPLFNFQVLQEHKSFERCWKKVTEKARKMAVNNCACVSDEVVFGWIYDYYEADDEAEVAEEKRKAAEAEEKRKADEEKRKAAAEKRKAAAKKRKAAKETAAETEAGGNDAAADGKEAGTRSNDKETAAEEDGIGGEKAVKENETGTGDTAAETETGGTGLASAKPQQLSMMEQLLGGGDADEESVFN